MRSAALIAISLALCTIASAQRLEIDGDGFRASTDVQGLSQEIGMQWLDRNVGVTWEDITFHAGLLVAGIAHYFIGNLTFVGFSGESLIPIFMARILGEDYVEKATDSLFRLQPY